MVGDSIVIIQHMHYQTIHHDIQLGRLIIRTQSMVKSYETIEFFQVLRSSNASMNMKPNEAVHIEVGRVNLNKKGPIPSHLS
jgi:hypothetical protein